MHAESTALRRARAFELSAGRYAKVALLAAGALYLILATGATVRLTASGLGCENWPGCSRDNPFPAKDYHAFVEFTNRMVGGATIVLTLLSWLLARRASGLPRWTQRLALGVFAGTFAQAPLGYLTVRFDLHPLLVLSHFLLSLVVLAGATVVALEALRSERGGLPSIVPREVRRLGLVLAGACLGLVVTGTFVTAAGPHSGGADIRRLGTVTAALWVHVRVTALFGCAFLFLLGYLAARRERVPKLFGAALGLLALVLVQMAVGEVQYRTELPWWLVLVHVALAGAVWVWTVALATWFYRPLAALAH